MKIDKRSITNFRTHFEDRVKELEKAFGVKISLGRITYNDSEFRVKMTARSNTALPTGVENPLDDVPTYLAQWTTKSKAIRGNVYLIVGYNHRARKYPVIAQREDGKRYKFAERAFTG